MAGKIQNIYNELMNGYRHGFYNTPLESVRSESAIFNEVCNDIASFTSKHQQIIKRTIEFLKNKNEFAEYQHPEKVVPRNPGGDRVFPLETVAIQQYREEHKRDIAGVTIHSGGYADEIARSYNALAITMADHIYFRSNAYNPYSEEGRKLLAHELTHVAQHKEGLIHPNITKDALEVDAEMGEKRAEYEDDPIITIEVDGEYFSFRESKMGEYASLVANDIREWMIDQKTLLDEEKYLKLLCAYEAWLKSTNF